MTEYRNEAETDAPIEDSELDDLFDCFRRVERILLAVSGGPDSMALLGLAARWREANPGFDLFAVTYDHRLRPAAAAEADLVARRCQTSGIGHRILIWEGAKPDAGLMEAARLARHAALHAFALEKGYRGIALAHHLDDQAETILMRLIAGSGLSGLAAMEAETPVGPSFRKRFDSCEDERAIAHERASERLLLRPFLDIPKGRLVATCRARGWPYAEDPSNRDDRFLRARLRRIMPLLAREGLTATRLARLGARARRNADVAAAAARRWLREHPPARHGEALAIDGKLCVEPEEIVIRVVGLLIERVGRDLPNRPPERLERLEALALALRDSAESGPPIARTYRGVVASCGDGGRRMLFRPAPPRRRSS